MIPLQFALRRRMMSGGGAFEFTYTGQFTDKIEGANRVIKFTSSGILQVSADVDVDMYLLAGGGGAIIWLEVDGSLYNYKNGGSGGSINKRLTLNASQPYEITIGTGGTGYSVKEGGTGWQLSGGTGGTTQAFGLTCTGGTGAVKKGSTNGKNDWYSGSNGSPYNGATNRGRGPSESTKNGGDGYVTITFS